MWADQDTACANEDISWGMETTMRQMIDNEQKKFFQSSVAKQKSERALQAKAQWSLKIENEKKRRYDGDICRKKQLEKRTLENLERQKVIDKFST
jgi:hypothetical protein